MQYRVKFALHQAAKQAVTAAPKLGLCKYAFIAYRDYDPYNGRGWCTDPRVAPCACAYNLLSLSTPSGRCICEEELCTELLARLAVFPKMKSTLDSLGLPPKLLSLETGKQTEEVQLQLESTEL